MAVTRSCAFICSGMWLAALLGCAPDAFEYTDRSGGPASPSAVPADCDGPGCAVECPPGTARSAAGACEAVCGNWSKAVDLFAPSGITLAGQQVIASGTSFDGDGRPVVGHLQVADACNGAARDGVVLAAGDGSTVSAVATSEATLFTVGTVETAGVSEPALFELDPSSHVQKAVVHLTGLPAGSTPVALAPGGGGAWIVGKSDAEPWIARVASGKSQCAAPLPGVGAARAVGALADGAVVIVDRGGKTAMLRIDEASCSAALCSCAPALTVEAITVGGSQIAPAAVVIADRTAYVVGRAEPAAGEPFAVALALDVDTGATLSSVTWDPGAGAEGFAAVTLDGTALFAGGTVQAPGAPARAALVAFALPLEGAKPPAWTHLSSSGSGVVDLARGGDIGVFALTRGEGGTAFVQRCDVNGC